MRARSYHASPGLAKASVLCISVWMIYINTLVSRRRAVDWRVCGNVDNRLGPTGRRSGLASLSTDEARVPTALVEIAIQLGPGDLALSGVADAKLRSDAREWMAVYGCGRALVAAVVAATVAVGDTGGPPASQAGSRIRAASAESTCPRGRCWSFQERE